MESPGSTGALEEGEDDIASVCNSLSSFRLLEAGIPRATPLESLKPVGSGLDVLGLRGARVWSLRAVALNLY